MATNTYVALDKVTVSGSSTTSITFNSINQGYTHLLIVVNAASSSAASCRIRFNGDTSTNYSDTRLYGDGSSVTSDRLTNRDHINCGDLSVTSINSNQIINVMNYSNATTCKTVLTRSNIASSYVFANVSLWRATPAAITSVTVFPASGNFIAGSTFSLYGIAAASVGAKATGGTIYSDSQYYYHVFGSTGTFTPTQSLTADVLVVAGGGGGGSTGVGGGGGGGGFLAYTSQSLTATGYTCQVGAGGAVNANGGGSQFGALTASVGGGAGVTSGTGGTGGSGGGGGIPSGAGGSATSGQGNTGGTAFSSGSGTTRGAGGGGGAGAVGANGASGAGGTGGNGSSAYTSWSTVTGIGQLVSSTYYLAGGGGGGSSAGTATTYAGGYGGGGAGTGSGTVNAIAGTANTGGGGGGGGTTSGVANSTGAAGGSGVVIIRYAK